MAERYIIDTDIGDDIDDAFAVLLALKGGLPVIGITTVFRNCIQRAKLTKRFLSLSGFGDIPVYAGADYPLVQCVENIFPPEVLAKEMRAGVYTLPQWTKDLDSEVIATGNAIDYIIDVARSGHELKVLALGPLTNLALAIRKAPDIISKVKEIIFIGGCYSELQTEWNIACDPEAAHIVFSSGIPVYALGLELVKHCPLTTEMRSRLLELGKLGEMLLLTLEMWVAHYGERPPVLYDALAAAYAIDRKLVDFSPCYVRVGLMGDEVNRYKTMAFKTQESESHLIFAGKSFDEKAWEKIFMEKFYENDQR